MLRVASIVLSLSFLLVAIAATGTEAGQDRDLCYGVVASPIGNENPHPLTACRYAALGSGHSVETLSWVKDCGRSTVVVRFTIEERSTAILDVRIPTLCPD